MRPALLAIAVGLVLADSSVVTLGLPDVLADFDATPTGVSWVLTGYNLVLALAAVPAALLAAAHRRARRGRAAAVAGLLVFAAASLVCALSRLARAARRGALRPGPGRRGRGLRGARRSWSARRGDRARGRSRSGAWQARSARRSARPRAALLTEVLSWEAIFAVQVPLALRAACVAARGARASARRRPAEHAPGLAGARLARFLGAGLTAALFLLVLLLIAGWRHSPLDRRARSSP